jgi:CheY-like chemotaxis protein/HPt (histidine-containing phosphotransfer) domain-containing protein
VQKSSQEQRILVGLLADWECTIMPTDEPSKVLMLTDEGAVDVALVDDSEDFDAFAVADSLRSSLTTAGANLPIVLMTGRGLDEVRTEGLKAGIDAYLAKPVDADRLFQTLSGLADIRETPQGRPALFNPDGTWEMAGEDAQLLEDMLGLFERDAPILIDAIGIAVDDGDAQGLRTGAHTLKGMLATICAESLTESAGALETFGVEGRAADAAEVLEKFERQMTALSQELSNYYDR